MLLSGLRFKGAVQRALSLAGIMAALATSQAQSVDYAGALPEEHLPGLKAVLETALKQSPQILVQQLEIQRNEARILEESYERWPQLGGNLRYDSNKTAATASASSRDSGLFYSLQLNQAIFHWGEIKHRGDVAKIQTAVAQKDFAEAYRTLVVQLRQTYLGLIARNAGLRNAQFGLALKKTDLENARLMLARGNISAGEAASRELEFNELQLEVDRLQAEFDGERRRLCRLAGISPDIPADEIPAEIPETHFDPKVSSGLLADLLRDGAKNTFRAQAADLHVKEADLNYRIARVRLLPKINAGLGHTRESSTTASATQVSQTAITRDTLEIRGDWNIFDGFATKGFKAEAIAQKRAWEKRRDIEVETAMDEAQRLAKTVGIDARAVQYAEQHRAGAAAAVSLAEQDKEKTGTVSQAGVDAATRNLRYAEWNLALARATFLSDWSAFVSLAGEDPALKNLPARYVNATR